MKNKTLFIICAFAAVFCLLLGFFLKQTVYKNPTAYIYSNGKLVKTVELNKLKEDVIFTVGGNTVLAQKNKISVIKANCPDKLCVKQGAVSNGAYPLVCLPNRLEIRIKDGIKK